MTPLLFDIFRLDRRWNFSVIKSVQGLHKILTKFDPNIRICYPKHLQKYLIGTFAPVPSIGRMLHRKDYYELSKLKSMVLLNLCADSKFVYLYEGTPAIKELLSKNHIGYIDFRVSPIRYNLELYLDIAANKYVDPYNSILVNFINNQLDFKSDQVELKKVKAKTLLFVGQKENDVAMLDKNNGQQTWKNFSEEIYKVSQKYAKVMYRPHPLSNGRDFEILKSILGNIELDTSSSIYNLFDGDYAFCALSSSVLTEASSFGLETHRLMETFPLVSEFDSTNFENVSISQSYRDLGHETLNDVRVLLGGKWSPAFEKS